MCQTGPLWRADREAHEGGGIAREDGDEKVVRLLPDDGGELAGKAAEVVVEPETGGVTAAGADAEDVAASGVMRRWTRRGW